MQASSLEQRKRSILSNKHEDCPSSPSPASELNRPRPPLLLKILLPFFFIAVAAALLASKGRTLHLGNGEMGNRAARSFEPPVVMGDESLMAEKGHGTCTKAVQDTLKWNVDAAKADKICCFNRHYAEHSGYFSTAAVSWRSEVEDAGETEYFDSVHGKRVFIAPKGRTFKDFLIESKAHGWPSFRDNEVDWDHVRILPDGECVTVDGVHLGHNLPDSKGNRYCINLVCIAGHPQ